MDDFLFEDGVGGKQPANLRRQYSPITAIGVAINDLFVFLEQFVDVVVIRL